MKIRVMMFVLLWSISWIVSLPQSLSQTNNEIEQGIQLFNAQKYAEAKRSFESLVSGKTTNALVAYYLGRIYLREGNSEKAIQWLEQAKAAETSNSDYYFWLGRAYAIKVQRVGLLKKAAAARQIKNAFEQAVKLNPDNLEARMALLQFYAFAPGIIGGSKDNAREQTEQIRLRNEHQGHLAFGFIHAINEKYDLATQEFRAAMTMKPDDPQAYYQLSSLYARQKQWDHAWELMEQLLAKRPEEATVHFYLGRLAVMSEQRLDRGEEHLKKYLETEPNPERPSLAFARLQLGHLYKLKGDKQKAAAEYREALKLDPNFEPAKKALDEIKK